MESSGLADAPQPRWARLICRRGTWWVVLLVTGLALAGLTRLDFDDDYRRLFRSDDARFDDYAALLDRFGSDENDCLLLVEGDDVLSSRSLAALYALHKQLRDVPDVAEVLSVFSIRGGRRVGRYFLPVITGDFDSAEKLEAQRGELLRHPLVRGRLVSNDRRATLVAVRLSPEARSVRRIEAAVDRLQPLLDAQAAAGLKITLTGLPAMRSAIVRLVQRDQVVFTGAGMVLAAGVAWVLFRRIVPLVIVSAAPQVGVLWVLGGMGWAGEHLNVINAVVPVLILVIGFTDSVHLMFHVRKLRDAGASPREAAVATLAVVGPACFVTAVTTAIGFGSLVASQDEIIRRFAVVCACGTLVGSAAGLSVIPLLVAGPLGRYCLSPPAASASGILERALGHWLGVVERRPRLFAVGSLAVTGVLLVIGLRIRPEYQFSENLPTSHPACQALQRCDEHFGGVWQVHVVVASPAEPRPADPEFAGVLADVHGELVRNGVLHAPMSIATLVDSLPGTDAADRAGQLQFVPPEILARFFRPDLRQTLVTAHVADRGASQLQSEFASLTDRLQQLEQRRAGYRFTLTGLPVMSSFRSQGMIGDLVASLSVDCILIFGIITLAFRSPWLGVASILPNGFPLVVLAAGFVLFDAPIRYSGVLAFSVCLGIAVDDTVHFLSHFRRDLGRHGDVVRAVRESYLAVVPAVITSAVILVLGFGVSILSAVPSVRMFGGLSCLALTLALMGDLFMLPAILLSLRGRFATFEHDN